MIIITIYLYRSWLIAENYLKNYEVDAYEELCTPLAESGSKMTAGRGGKAIPMDTNWRRFCQGKGKFGGNDKVVGGGAAEEGYQSIWQLSKHERRGLLRQWSFDNFTILILSKELYRMIRKCSKYEARIKDLRISSLSHVLCSKMVIGCTTNFAAKNMSLISRAEPTGK